MPLDPRIALIGAIPQVQPVEYASVLLNAARIREARQQEQIRQLALTDAMEQQAQQQRFEAYLRAALQSPQGQPTPTGLPSVPLSQIAPALPGERPYPGMPTPQAPWTTASATPSPAAMARAQTPPATPYTRAPLPLQPPAVQATLTGQRPGVQEAATVTHGPGLLDVDWRKAWSLWPRGGLQVLGAMREYEQGNTFALLEPIQKGITALRQIQGTIHDQASLDRARTRLQQIPDVAALLPQTYTPEAMAQFETRLMPLAERLTLQMQAEKLRIEQLKEQREAQKGRLLEGLTSGLSGRIAPSGGPPSRGLTPPTPATSAVQEQIVSEAQRQGVDPALALTFADIESGFRDVPGDGGQAQGYFQLHERAAQDAAQALGLSPQARLTPEGNIRLGVQYAKQVLERGGTPEKAFALYNWGTPTYQGKGDPQYVQKAMQTYAQYQGQTGAVTDPYLQTYDRQIQELDTLIARYSAGAIDQDVARVLGQLNDRRSALRAERAYRADQLREQRQLGRETRRDIGTLKRQAGADIRDSALTPEQKAQEFATLAEITSPEAADTFATRAASLPKAQSFGEEREALTQELFSVSYEQADTAQKAIVNQRLRAGKERYELFTTETGMYLRGDQSGNIWQIDPAVPGGKRLLTPPAGEGTPPGPASAGPPPAPAPGAPALPLSPSMAGPPPPAPVLPQPPSLAEPVAPPAGGGPTPPLTTPVPQPPRMAPSQGPPLAQPPLPPPAEPAIVARPPVLTPTMPPPGVITPAQAAEQGVPVPSQVAPGGQHPSPLLRYEEMSPFTQRLSEPVESPRAFGAKPRTTEQQRAFGFGNRALQAEEHLERLEAQGEYGDAFWHQTRRALQQMSPTEAAGLGAVLGGTLGLKGGGIVGTVVGGVAGAGGGLAVRVALPVLNLLDTPAQRAHFAAKLAFIGANLRKESGMNITAQEFEREEKIYFPQFNEPQDVRESKRLFRQQAIEGMASEAGRKLLMPKIPRPLPPPRPPEQDIPEEPGARRETTLRRLTTLPPAQIERGDADVSLQFLQQSGLTATQLIDAVGLERFYAIKRRLEALNRPR